MAPLAIVHCPPQHCPFDTQASPFWMQNEEALQTPPAQSPEQQSVPVAHAFPSVLHCVLSGAHVPLLQAPLQQPAAHARLCQVQDTQQRRIPLGVQIRREHRLDQFEVPHGHRIQQHRPGPVEIRRPVQVIRCSPVEPRDQPRSVVPM